MSALSAIGSFSISETITVPSDYFWDKGVPLLDVPYFDLIINDPPIAASTSSGLQYAGRSPFMSVTLSSTYTPNPSAVGVKRIYNFGDYYNSESNIQISTCFNDETVCHTYVMPGTYTISMTIEEYVLIPKIIIPQGQYKQQTNVSQLPKDAFWQWRNFLCNDLINPLNRKLTWNYSTECFCCYTWKDAVPCLCQPICVWDATCPIENTSCIDPGPQCEPMTWQSTLCDPAPTEDASYDKWEQKTCATCLSEEIPDMVVVKTIYQKQLIVTVKETLPIAYIDVYQDPSFLNRNSPYTVRLTAKNTKSGSFPIERIDWDLGDGTPIKTQRRWAISTDPEFIYTDNYPRDWKDPRNYEIIHTYYVEPNSNLTFYPSLTCYTSSTASSDCAKGIVGPINPAPPDSKYPENEETTIKKPLNIIQNEITDEGNLILGEVNCTAAVWKHNK